MKIAHVCTIAGSHKILIDKLELLEKKGFNIDIISSEEGFDHSLIKDTNINVKFITMSREISLFKDLKSIIKMFNLFKQEKYDIIHTHTAKAGLIGRIASRLAKTPLTIHTSHGLPFYEGQPFFKHYIYKFFEILGARFCDILLSQNKEDVINLQNISQGRPVFYEGNGVDVEKIEKKTYDHNSTRNKIKKEFDLNNKYIFLVAARFEAVKDHDFLIESVKLLVEKYNPNDFVVLLAGKGNLEDEIKNKVNQYGLENIIKLIGYQKDIYKFINIADSVILTSQKEGVPRILMESMLVEKLVIGTDVLGTRELIINNQTGLLVKYRDINHLAKQLNIAMREDHTILRKNARQHILENFTEKHVVERLNQIYLKAHKSKMNLNKVNN